MAEQYYYSSTQNNQKKVERPLGIALIAFIGILISVIEMLAIFTISFLSFLAPVELGELISFQLLSFIFLLISLVQFAVSYGLWKMKKWALNIQIGLYILNTGLGALELLIVPPALIILVIPLYIIHYLRSKRNLFS